MLWAGSTWSFHVHILSKGDLIMKKALFLFLCLMVMGTGLFALEKAVGFGLLYNYSTTSGDYSINVRGIDYTVDWDLSRNGFGAFGFFGFSRFLEANLGLLYKNPNKLSYTEKTSVSTASYTVDGVDSVLGLQLGLYGKYPIPLSDTFVFFPTVGVDAEISLGGGSKDTDSTVGSHFKWWNDLWLRGGLGMDIFMTQTMFIRSHLIYGYGIPVGGDATDVGAKSTHGLLIKVGLGWML